MLTARIYPLVGFLLCFYVFAIGCNNNDGSSVEETPDAGIDAGETEPVPGSVVVDDFEDGNNESALGGFWFTYTDADNGGASTITVALDAKGNWAMDGEGFQSERSLYLEYTLDQGEYQWDPYVGWGVTMGNAALPYDMTAYEGITYAHKGSAHKFVLATGEVKDYDYYGYSVPASKGWAIVEVPFRMLAQEGWGEFVPLSLNNVIDINLNIAGPTGLAGEFWMDDLKLVEDLPSVEDLVPDLAINDPQPPEDEVIESIEISNPLQALAIEKLNKGYNITNWLENEKFKDYKYDESYVAALAGNGFKSLRLPIDLDLYIANRDTYFKGETKFEIEELLYSILDSFATWTETHGLAFTIDYHQYDKTFDMDNELYVEAVLGLWKGIATHFAPNKRNDLFYEIMNEPELAGGTSSVSQEKWRAFAEGIIAGIRTVDPTRGVLFGDVNWNAVKPLIEQGPLKDTGTIYVFHFYDPFIFTHQGADWAGMATTHDIPYPYSKERWLEHSSDFGFDPNVHPSWQVSSLHGYYRTGNKSTLRNTLIEAKRWAVENNVPVICTEFGAYDRSSRLEDRVSYLADLKDIFAELEIPWQHWYMIMDYETHEVDPVLKTALGL